MRAETDDALARRLAGETGALLLAQRDRLFALHTDPSSVKDAADRLAQGFLAEQLAQHRPEDAVLSEEAEDTDQRLISDRVWIIDPLDGTREYAIPGRDDWAVHIALWSADRPAEDAVIGAVALPSSGRVLSSVDIEPVALQRHEPELTVVVSGSRTPTCTHRLAAELPARIERWGSAGVKASRVILGYAAGYLHDTQLNEWDAAAPVAVARAAGLHVSHLDGTPVLFNRPDPSSGSLLICRPELADRMLAIAAP